MIQLFRMTRIYRLSLLLITLLLIVGGISSVKGKERAIGKTVLISLPENATIHMAAEVLREAYKQIGYIAEFTPLPTRRALIWAAEGKTDGDVARIKSIENQFQSLIRVPTPVITATTHAFTLHSVRKIHEWKDLRDTRIGIIRGMWFAEKGTEGMDALKADSTNHLFVLLVNNRIDIAIPGDVNDGKVEISRNFRNHGIHVIGEPLFQAPLYHYVHKRNAHMVPLVDRALQEIIESGQFDKILTSKLHELMKP